MLLTKKAKLASWILLSAGLFLSFGFEFEDAQKAFRAGHCAKAISIGRQVMQESRYAPDQVIEDRATAVEQWQQASEECEALLPDGYKDKIDEFEGEYKEVAEASQGVGKTDDACELLRRVAVFSNEVKYLLATCNCLERSQEVEALLKRVMVLCPKPCKDADREVDDIYQELNSVSKSIRLSTKYLKTNKIGAFRKRIRHYQYKLLTNKAKADTIANSMAFCLGRKGNRNLGLVIGSSENLMKGLSYINNMCGFIQSLHNRIKEDSGKNKAFRDSISTFFSQVNNVIDEWLLVSMPNESSKNITLQKTTSQDMHDMLFKLAKIDLERSLYLLDRPTKEKRGEIARLKALSFEDQLSPDETRELNELRSRVVNKLYYSIPWLIRFWDEQKNTAILMICLGCALIIAVVIIVILSVKKRKKGNYLPASGKGKTQDKSLF